MSFGHPFCPGQTSEAETPAQTPGPSGPATTQPSMVPNQPQTEYSEANTPLQLLSDDHAFALLFGVLWPVVRELDGLILTGGGDLSSCLFGKPPHPQTETPDA